MRATAVPVLVFAAPDAACAQGRTWSGATAFVSARLHQRFGDRISVEHVELFSARSFEFPDVLAAIERGGQLPVVVVNPCLAIWRTSGTPASSRHAERDSGSITSWPPMSLRHCGRSLRAWRNQFRRRRRE